MAITVDELRELGNRADALQRESREMLTAGVRRAARDGYSQRQIAAAIGRSQPEVSRLLRFIPRSKHGRCLAAHRHEILAMALAHGVSNVGVFGSTARGSDGPSSDLDLLIDVGPDVGLFDLSRLELTLSDRLNLYVDLVPATMLRDRVADEVLNEAVPL